MLDEKYTDDMYYFRVKAEICREPLGIEFMMILGVKNEEFSPVSGFIFPDGETEIYDERLTSKEYGAEISEARREINAMWD